MRRFALLTLCALFLSGWGPVSLGGDGTSGAGGGGGGGGACAAPTNYATSAAHLYFWQDNSWAVAGDPDDEGGGTDQALEASANLTDSGDLSNADLPDGTPETDAYYALDMNGTDETALTGLNEPGFLVASNFGDFTLEFWTKTSELTGADDWFLFHGNSDLTGWVAVDTDGTVVFATPLDSGSLETSASAVGTGTWHHIAVVDDGDGAGNSTRTIYVDGASAATDSDTSLVDSGGTSDHGFLAVDAMLLHGVRIQHGAATATQIKERVCCGINGEVEDVAARETLTSLDCSEFE